MFKYNKEITFAQNTSHGEILNLISEGEKVLEFGCAKGELASQIKDKLGGRVWGIEIDSGAFATAKEHLEGGVVCDIENYEWEKEFEGAFFDTLLFADVLEHLRDPAKAIKRALPLLKDDGKIIFSVPNIAHSDIIVKLLNNRFDYTDIGLLDNTHIHFFARENLVPFCSDAEIFPTFITGTTALTGTTEQKMDASSSFAFNMATASQENSDIYQFVICAVKKSVGENMQTIWNLKENSTPATIYFDTGAGFNAEQIATVPCDEGDFELEIDLPSNILRVRIDVRETAGFVIKNMRCTAGERVLLPSEHHNLSIIDGNYLLFEKDSQLVFDIPRGEGKLCFAGNLSNAFKSPDNIPYKLSSNLEGMANERNDAVSLSTFLEGENKTLKSELEHYRSHYLVAIGQRDDLSRQLADMTNKYNTISNAGWWKITKPFRVLFDILKWPFRHGPLLKVRKFLKVWREQSFRAAWKKAFRGKANKKANAPLFTPKELEAQRKKVFEHGIKFSVIVPLYNTPEQYLIEMIESVIAQTYSNWELCLADGSDDSHENVGKLVQKYAKKDPRILYKKLEKNLGISGNTNACLEMSSGDYISLFDHDDLLHESALYCVMEAIEKDGADFIYTDENTFHVTPKDAYHPHFKPDFSPDTLRSYNYICHFTSFSRALYSEVGGFRSEFDGSQDYDMILRLTEKASKIVHIPKILYYWRCHKASVASDISAKPYTLVAAKKALDEHLCRLGLSGKSVDTRIPSVYKIEYDIVGEPLVSIIIANKDYIDDLDKCITSIVTRSTYKNYEIIVVENNSTDPRTFNYYDEVTKRYPQVRVVYWKGQGFNYSKINNFGFEASRGEHIILLNNDIEILTPSWIEEMLMFSQREDVGAVGAMLYYPDDTVQHAGVIIGIGADPEAAVAGHSHKYFKRGEYGYASRLCLAQNLSAVTAACIMIRASVYEAVGGLDESFAVAFNDVDLCMKIRESGHLIVWTPFAEAYHYESKSRGLETTPEKVARFNSEINNFLGKWRSVRDAGDPYYNPNLTLEREDFGIR